MWGIIPAAGLGSRIQPLAFSKELLPVGSCGSEGGRERPRAISEYLVDRMLLAGVDKLCFVISPSKADIVEYFGAAQLNSATAVFVVQPQPAGLCDAIFRAAPLIADEDTVTVGLPDTIWFPEDGLASLPEGVFSFLLFPVEHPEYFDVVRTDGTNRVLEIQVKPCDPRSQWVWGAFKIPGAVFHELHSLWLSRDRADEYIGTLVNTWILEGGSAQAFHLGSSYVDIGTLNGYREAITLLSQKTTQPSGSPSTP